MFLSRSLHNTNRRNVIKSYSTSRNLEISDYRLILEEVEADKMPEVKIDLVNLDVGLSAGPTGDGTHDNSAQSGESETRKATSEAFEKGFDAGKNETIKALQGEYDKKVKSAVASIESVLQGLTEEVVIFRRDFDKAIVTLALAIARRIVARDIEIDEGAVLARSHEAIRKIVGVDKIKIHINPADEEYIREHRSELNSYADSVKEIIIEADSKVEPGGCVIESDLGNIDARVSTQFELIEEALQGLIK